VDAGPVRWDGRMHERAHIHTIIVMASRHAESVADSRETLAKFAPGRHKVDFAVAAQSMRAVRAIYLHEAVP
jgi:hypothetical protein